MAEPGRFGRRGPHPSWWPANESWPPKGPPWGGHQRRIFRRVAILFAVLALLMIAGAALGWLLFGGSAEHRGEEWSGPPIFGFVLLAAGAFLVVRLLRRTTAPLTDILDATSRLAAGDYSVRVKTRSGEAGPSSKHSTLWRRGWRTTSRSDAIS